MTYETIMYSVENHIATITFNQPENLNAWSFRGGMTDEFHAALTEAEDNDDVKVVVMRGAGRAFSSGHDLSEVGYVYGFSDEPGQRRPSQRIRLQLDHELFAEKHRRLFLFPKITIAQVHGDCVGEGMILVEAADFALAAESARLSHAEQRLGFAGSGVGTIPLLIMHVGMKRAIDILVTGRTLSGCEAAEYGLVTRAVPDEELDGAVEDLAERLSRLPKDGIAIGKATRRLAFDSLGLCAGFNIGAVTHTLFTNLRWERDEYNFFRERRAGDVHHAVHERDSFYEQAGESETDGTHHTGRAEPEVRRQ